MTAVSQDARMAKPAALSAIPLELWKQAAAAGVITFLLASLIVGIETVSSTGALAFTTRYKEVVIVTIAVFFGALVIGLLRSGRPLSALVGGGLVTVAFSTILVLQNPSEVRIQAVLIPVMAVLFGMLAATFAGEKRRLLTIAAGALVPVVLAVLLERGEIRNQVVLAAIAAAAFVIMGVGALRAGARNLVLVIGGAAIAMIAVILAIGDSTEAWQQLIPFKSPIVNWGALLVPLSIFARAIKLADAPAHAGAHSAAGQGAIELAQRIMPWVGGAMIVIAVALPWLPLGDRTMEKKIIDICTIVLTYVMLGWGLNIVVGLAGLLDLGYVAFYAVGAYTYAMLSVYLGWSFWVCLPLAGLLAATFGVLLGFPVLRLRGDYLAIVTLGFGEMIRIIIVNWRALTGGPNGINRVPRASFFGLPMERNPPEGVTSFHQFFGLEYNPNHRVIFLYYLVLVAALIVNFFTLRIRKLPLGRAWEALREDETACRALGINPTNTKLTAFAVGAMFGGFAGSFFAVRNGFISPESFVFLESAIILAIVVLGGLGSQVGIVLAAAVLIGVPEMFRELSEYRMLAFGIGMVLIMVWRPGGLLAHREPTVRLHSTGGRAGDAKR